MKIKTKKERKVIFKMKYDVLVIVNNKNEEVKKQIEERKIKNRIKKFVKRIGVIR